MDEEHVYKKNKWSFEQFCVDGIRFLSLIMLMAILLFTLWNTTFVLDTTEHCYFLLGHPVRKVVGIIISVFVGMIFYKYRERINLAKIAPNVLYAITLCIGLCWILVTQAVPIGDSEEIFEVAQRMAAGDASDFVNKGYVYLYPFQKGIILLIFVLQKFVGTYNYLFFQVLNVFAIIVIEYMTYHLTLEMGKSGDVAKIILLAMTFYIPAIMYTSFTYGILLGLAFSISGFYFIYQSLTAHKILYGIGGTICLALACTIKPDYVVPIIAVVILLGIVLTRKWNWKILGLLILVVSMYFLQSFVVNSVTEKITGVSTGETLNTYKLDLVTGLSDDGGAPGWFQGFYFDTIYTYGDDPDTFNQVVDDKLDELITERTSSYQKCYDFFAKKTASQWCEPTFQGNWLVLVRDTNQSTDSWIRYCLVAPYAKVNRIMRSALDLYTSLICFGAICFVLFYRKRDILPWVGLIIIFGGFCVHLIGEAKAQYSFAYFMMLMPYGLVGLCQLVKWIYSGAYKQVMSASWWNGKKAALLFCIVAMTAFVLFSGVNYANMDDIQFYQTFLITG